MLILCYYIFMKKQNDSINFITDFNLKRLGDPKDILFIDIETTGLSRDRAYIYLIGVAVFDGEKICLTQWLAEHPSDEEIILRKMCEFIKDYRTLIHFNGNAFDIPFIKARLEANSIEYDMDEHRGIDIYKRIYPYRNFLKMSSIKQTAIEDFLSVIRHDEYNGQELIKVYKEYVKSKDSTLLHLLMQHNHEDVVGMTRILPILNYGEIFDNDLHIKKVESNQYRDVNDIIRKELLITFDLPYSIPVPLAYNSGECYLSIKDCAGILKVPVYHEELKYYYDNYKDYYYLPEEDMAIHKSVAIYVDKDFRTQATAQTCYTRKESDFLPQWDYLFTPFFKREYKSANLFFELTEETKRNREFFSKYVKHILEMMVKSK